MNIDFNAIAEQISFSSKFICATVMITSITKIALTNYFLWKIEQTKQSRIVIRKGEKTMTATRSNEAGAIRVFKSLDENQGDEDVEETWKNVS